MANSDNPYAAIPSIERLMQRPDLVELAQAVGHAAVRNALREATGSARAMIRDKRDEATGRASADALARAAIDLVQLADRSSLVPVFNLTGTVLHTNLGRAALPSTAVDAIVRIASTPVTLEFNLADGRRGDRDDHVEALICELTGAPAATVVNNNAAAVMLCLNSMADGREVPVSRGELIEIGGSFRMPAIMERAGCDLVEVGTTNRTHLADYEQAIGPATAALMIVHPSNYDIRGFTAKPTRGQIADLAHRHALPLIDDLGSGTLIDLEQFGLAHEVTVREAIAAGADIVTFSGDKLLGGPQAGIVVGREDLIAAIKRNPMKRAMRVDKLTLAALEAVLRLYRNPDKLVSALPTMAHLSRPLTQVEQSAQQVQRAMQQQLDGHGSFQVVDCQSQIGSGALPAEGLPSRAVQVAPKPGGGRGVKRWSDALRALPIPVIGRISDNHLLLDMRTLDDCDAFVGQLEVLAGRLDSTAGPVQP